jgi:hypothetical protein
MLKFLMLEIVDVGIFCVILSSLFIICYYKLIIYFSSIKLLLNKGPRKYKRLETLNELYIIFYT